MPIVPRFARQTDPNAVQTSDFAGALQEGMLAGTQVKRTKLAEEEMKQRGEMLRMSIEDRANARTTQEDLAKVEGFFMEKGNEPLDDGGVGSAPLAPGQQGPAAMNTGDIDRMEMEGARAFMDTLRSPQAKAQFAEQFRGYKADRQIQLEARGVQARVQDLLVNLSQVPEAAPYMAQLEGAAAKLDMLDDPGIPPEKRALLLDSVTTEANLVEAGARKEAEKQRAKLEAIAGLQATAGQYPATSSLGQRLRTIALSAEFGADPIKAQEDANNLVMGYVRDPDNPDNFIKEDALERRRVAQVEATSRLYESKTRRASELYMNQFETVEEVVNTIDETGMVTGSKTVKKRVPVVDKVRTYEEILSSLDEQESVEIEGGIDAVIGGGKAPAAPAQRPARKERLAPGLVGEEPAVAAAPAKEPESYQPPGRLTMAVASQPEVQDALRVIDAAKERAAKAGKNLRASKLVKLYQFVTANPAMIASKVLTDVATMTDDALEALLQRLEQRGQSARGK